MKNTFKNTFNTEEGILDEMQKGCESTGTHTSQYIYFKQQISFVLIK